MRKAAVLMSVLVYSWWSFQDDSNKYRHPQKSLTPTSEYLYMQVLCAW